ncbi:MAG: flagellar type III secretion system pore protein FliP [Pseudomonadota bacterium]
MKRTGIILTVMMLWLTWSPAAMSQDAVDIDPEVEALIEDTRSLREAVLPTVALVTVLSLAPGILMMVTCFPFIAIIFSFLRQAMGLQTAPPAMMLTSLAIFLTYFIMEPVFADAWTVGIKPVLDGDVTEIEGTQAAMVPFRSFMEQRVSEDTLFRLADAIERPVQDLQTADFSLLVPSFMLSEITRAFQIGFAIFLPFLVIDLVVASILMAMGMMMVPPAVVALPFKLAFFVIADGWVKIVEALLRGYLQ